jgi:tetratricopeptide (TPR) repeat protein
MWRKSVAFKEAGMASDADRDLARQQLERGEYDAAIASYDRALARQPKDADLLFGRGLARFRKEDYPSAAHDFTCVLRERPNDANALFNRALARRRSGDAERANEDYSAYLERQPQDRDALLERGRCRLELNVNAGALALADFNQILKLTPDDAEALFERGRAYLFLSQWQNAIDDFDRTLKLAPAKFLGAYFNRALAKAKLEDHRGAIADYSRHLEHYPRHVDSYVNRGHCHKHLFFYAKAVEDFEKAVALDPKRARELRSQIGEARRFSRQPGAIALVASSEVLQLKPEDVAALFDRGRAYLLLSQWQCALDDFDQTVKIDPANYPAYYHRGLAKAKLEDHRGAIADYSRYLEHYPRDVDAYLKRGRCHEQLCLYAKVVEDLEKAVALDPKRASALQPQIANARRSSQRQRQPPSRKGLVRRSWASLHRFGRRSQWHALVVGLPCVLVIVGAVMFPILLFSGQFRPFGPITNPLIDGWLYTLLICLAPAIAVAFICLRAGTRSMDKLGVRDAILRHLQLPLEAASLPAAREQLLALILCRVRQLQGRLSSLNNQRRLWLCFLEERLLVISSRTGAVLELPSVEFQGIYLVGRASGGRFLLGIEMDGAVSFVELSRLDDMVRIVNILKRQGTFLRYLKRAS